MKNILLTTVIFICTFSSFAQSPSSFVTIKDSIVIKLPEVFINAEYPIMKISDDGLVFNIPELIKNRSVNTAFDALKELPGISVEGDNVYIIGTPNTNIIINGKKSTMTLNQVIDMLKSTLAKNVNTIDVFYTTPPQFGIRGSTININLKKRFEDYMSLETQLTGRQSHYFSPTGILNYSLSNKNITLTTSYSISNSKRRSEEDIYAYPIINEEKIIIDQNNTTKNNPINNQINVNLFYTITDKKNIDFSYSGSFNNKDYKRNSYVKMLYDSISMHSISDATSNLHNGKINFEFDSNKNIGIDFAYFNDNNDQNLSNIMNDYIQSKESVYISSHQEVSRINSYINLSSLIVEKVRLNYGAKFEFSNINNNSYTKINNENNGNLSFKQTQKEMIGGIYASINKNFNNRVILNASINIEYGKAFIDSLEKRIDLWSRLNVFPQINIIYNVNSKNTIIASVSSDKKYPAYWAMSNNLTYLNAYTYIKGNPLLKPELIYSHRINYIHNKKYVFTLFFNYHDNYLRQQYYLGYSELKSYYKYINIKDHFTYGISVVAPFRLFDFLNSRLIATGFMIKDKGQLDEIIFNRNKMFYQVMLQNTITFPSLKRLSIDINCMYNSPSIQGLYNIENTYNLSAGLVYKPLNNDKLRITIRGEDLLNGLKNELSVNIVSQESQMTLRQDTRYVSLTVNYVIGKIKKSNQRFDSSRLGI